MRKEFEDAFGNCKYQEGCVCNTKESYEYIDDGIFYVFDEGGDSETPVKIVNANSVFQLTVKNNGRNSILLIKTDNCLFTDDNSKCDCILSSDSKIFFVEIKSCNAGGRGKSRGKAAEQLKSTIDLLKSKNIDFSSMKSSALICFKSTEPRIIQASRNSSNALFKQNYGVPLEEGNVIEF